MNILMKLGYFLRCSSVAHETRTHARTTGRFFLWLCPCNCPAGSVAHMLTLIVLVLTVSLHGQWFWLGWGWVMVLGQGSLFNSLSPFPPPLLPFIPLPIHLSCSNHLGSCHLIQLITDWDGLWETSLVRGFAQPKHTLTQETIYTGIYNMSACNLAWILGKPKRSRSH